MTERITIDRDIIEFAHKIAVVLNDSKSSTALFFVQQAFPDDIDSPGEHSTADEILENVIIKTKIALISATENQSELG